MKPIRVAPIALALAASAGALYAQPPGYGALPTPRPVYEHERDYDRNDESRYDRAPAPRDEVGFFYEELSPYGDWVQTREYGWAWFPRDMHPYWRPYSNGRWVNTDYGWTWASDEPFGWATYHYGRWARDPRFGWLWLPGTIWGPAWVSWQSGSGYVGWAPLPPSVGFETGIGIRFGGFDLNIGIRPDSYNFVPERSFLESPLSGYLLPKARNVTILHNTTNITSYTWLNDRVVNQGVEVRYVERVTGQRIRSLRVAEAKAKSSAEATPTELRIYRPPLQQLDSVRVGPRANAGLRRYDPRPAAERRDPELAVAARANRPPSADTQQVEKQRRRAQQELERYQADETRELAKLHRRDIARTDPRAERSPLPERHRAELEALQQEQHNATQQLAGRLQAQQQAALNSDTGHSRSKDPR